MLTIVRGRTWELVQEIKDSLDGPSANLSHLGSVQSEIRKKGNNEAVVEVTASLAGSTLTLSLTRQETAALPLGEYLIDVLGISESQSDESLMDPEPILIIDRPTQL